MPNWFKKDKDDDKPLPKELEGKTPEQVVTELKAAEALKTEIATLKADRETEKAAVQTLSTQFNDVRARLEAAELKAKPAIKTEEPTEWSDDPDKALGERVAPLAAVTFQQAALTSKLLAQQQLDNNDMISPADNKTMDGRLFRVWESDINAEAKKYQAQQMASPAAWIGIFYYVKGLHANELSNPEIRKKKYNFLESAAQENTPPPDKKTDVESLTDAEKHVADRMKVSYENYAKRKKAMQFVNV